MKNKRFSLKKHVLIILAFTSFTTARGLELPLIFSDNMVIQQNGTIHIWGWGNSWNSSVAINASWGASDTVSINSEGRWNAYIKTPTGGFDVQTVLITELALNKSGENISYNPRESIEIHNILIGEVWLCSGQSNMEMDSKNIIGSKEEIAEANHSGIRFFEIAKRTSDYPQDDFSEAKWDVCTPESMESFSAVGYFFGLDLKDELEVPIGLISDAWGGISIDAAYSMEAVKDSSILRESGYKQGYWDGAPHRPGVLYNAMTYPLRDYNIAGMLWYQGEGNVSVDPELYYRKQSVLVKERRKQFGEDMPFYFVQIAPYKYNNSKSPIIRDQQRMAASIKNTAMITISDIGDTLDIHPRQKKIVGNRLADLALKHHYKAITILVDPPLFKGAYKEKNKVIIEFSNSEDLHFEKGDQGHFEVAAADGNFVSVTAKVAKDKILLDTKKIEDPVAVRFAFSDTATPFLMNSAGLPASCFAAQKIEK